MTALVVRRRGGAFVLGEATLRTGWTWRRAQIRIGERTWTVEPTDRQRVGVAAYAANGVAVRLHPQRSQVPGPGGTARWRPGRRGGELTLDDRRIQLRIPRFSCGSVSVEVAGDWPNLELVTLTALFALMSRRRRRTLTTIAVVGATGHGPV
jgi:MYXO-CTERM domain-containing protein